MLPRNDVAEHFYSFVIPEPMSGCHLWIGARNQGGYGWSHPAIDGRSGDGMAAHRKAWMLERGPIPKGLVIDHLCRVTSCVNTRHMEAVTVRVNTMRGFGPSAMRGKIKCCSICGGPLTFRPKRGERECRYCVNALKRRAYWDKKERAATSQGCPAGQPGSKSPSGAAALGSGRSYVREETTCLAAHSE